MSAPRSDCLSPCLTKEQARMLSPLQLAFVGDSVHALLVRTRLIGDNLRVKDMHLGATRAVNAAAQAKTLARILPLLSDEEAQIVRRGRNAHAHHGAPRAATVEEYAGATGLEALLGYLYLTGDTARLIALAERMSETEE